MQQNRIILDGIIWGIRDSHIIQDVQYQKANITVKNSNNKDSVLNLQFKKFQCNCKENDRIQIVGNVRSYSEKVDENKNKVNIYVYTYFDSPFEEEYDLKNNFIISGKICKLEEMRYLNNDKNNIHFILVNNIITEHSKLNSYLPCIAWGNCAKRISNLNKNDSIIICGELRSREYKKKLNDKDEFELKIAHELLVTDFKKLENYYEEHI